VRLKRQKIPVTFVTDSREQRPWELGPPHRRELEDHGSIVYALDAGDYGVEIDGVLQPIRIERKSISDLFGVVGHGRERFVRELEKLRDRPAFLIIEATAAEVKHGYERSLVSGEAAIGSLMCWSIRFGVHVIFAGNRTLAGGLARRLLEEFAVHVGVNDGAKPTG